MTDTMVGAEDPSFMPVPPPWFSQHMEEVLDTAAITDDPAMQRHLTLAAITELIFQFAKVRDIHRDHHFIVHDLHRLMGLNQPLKR